MYQVTVFSRGTQVSVHNVAALSALQAMNWIETHVNPGNKALYTYEARRIG